MVSHIPSKSQCLHTLGHRCAYVVESLDELSIKTSNTIETLYLNNIPWCRPIQNSSDFLCIHAHPFLAHNESKIHQFILNAFAFLQINMQLSSSPCFKYQSQMLQMLCSTFAENQNIIQIYSQKLSNIQSQHLCHQWH